MMCLDMSRMANPMKNGFSTLRTGVFNLMPIRFSEYMVVPAIMSYPCFWMMGFTFIPCASKLHLRIDLARNQKWSCTNTRSRGIITVLNVSWYRSLFFGITGLWLNHTHRVVHDSFTLVLQCESESTLVIGIDKAIVVPVLYIGQREWTHLRLFGNPRRSMCAFSVYVWGVVDSPGEAELPSPLLLLLCSARQAGTVARSCMLFTRSSTRQGTDGGGTKGLPGVTASPPQLLTYFSLYWYPIDYHVAFLMRLLLVNSCLYVWVMLNTRFIYYLSR